MQSFSLTQELLSSDADGYQRATQSSFLRLAANGKISKELLGKWLANDRLYIHSYVRGIGRLISFLQFPDIVSASSGDQAFGTRLLDWLITALVNIRREEQFFLDIATRYGIEINLDAREDGRVSQDTKLKGLQLFEELFGTVSASLGEPLEWLEAAVIFWGTEKCYLDAWSWAQAQLVVVMGPNEDADGGAVRNEFIKNWTSDEFVQFVGELGIIIDEAVAAQIAVSGEAAKGQLVRRAVVQWNKILAAEEAFWPET